MNQLEEAIFNWGERLIPFVAHDIGEIVRFKSSHAFFSRVLDADRQRFRRSVPISGVERRINSPSCPKPKYLRRFARCHLRRRPKACKGEHDNVRMQL